MLQAQDLVQLRGKVLNDTIEKASLNVVNITFQKGAITDSGGSFVIPARLRDTINISAVQYESRQFVVSEKMFYDREVTLYLIPKITELDEVQLSNIDLTGNLKNDVENLVVDKVYSPKDFGIPGNTAPERTVEERRLYTATSSGGGIIPIGALINAITGRTKMLKKHVEVSKFQMKVERTRERLSDKLYMNELLIPRSLIEDFVFYALEDEEASKKVNLKNQIELLAYLQTKAPTYRKLKTDDGSIKEIPKEMN